MEPRVENPSGDGDEDEDEGTMDRESQVDQGKSESKKTSLWDHLQEEIWANDLESGQELKCELVLQVRWEGKNALLMIRLYLGNESPWDGHRGTSL